MNHSTATLLLALALSALPLTAFASTLPSPDAPIEAGNGWMTPARTAYAPLVGAPSTAQATGSTGPVAHNVTNGGFETGNFSGWTTVTNQSAGGGWFVYNRTAAPLSGLPLKAPPEGARAATTDQTGPGARHLLQSLAVPSANATLSFLLYYQNHASAFVTPDSFDYTSGPNQQVRVDLLQADADPESLAPGDIIATPFRVTNASPQTLPPTRICYDLSTFAGQTVQLRVSEVDTDGNLLASVDDVRVETGCPPSPPPPPAGADLVVEEIVARQVSTGGFVFGALIRNAGTDTAAPSTTEFHIDPESSVLTHVATPSIGAGLAAYIETTPSPAVSLGNHTMRVTADVLEGVEESNETNNVASITFRAVAIDFAIVDLAYEKGAIATDYTGSLVQPLAPWTIQATVVNHADDAGCGMVQFIVQGQTIPTLTGASMGVCLAGGSSETFAFEWRPNTVGNVLITAVAEAALGDTRPENDVRSIEAFVVIGGDLP